MKRNQLISIVAATFTLVVIPAVFHDAYAASGDTSLISANNSFGMSLTKSIAQDAFTRDPNQNILLSPASVGIALQMLLNGATPDSITYTQMTHAMGLENLDLNTINESNRAMISDFKSDNQSATPAHIVPFTVNIANSIWSDSRSSFKYNPNFLGALSEFYNAQANSVNFGSPAGANSINQWASESTDGKISKIIDAKTLSSLAFVMLNATYFKANWVTPFATSHTAKNAQFNLTDGTRSEVQMMQSDRFGYSETAAAQTMELPYAGGNASMFIVLPRQGSSVSALLASEDFQSSQFWTDLANAQKSKAEFSMPKFSFNYGLTLNDELKSMGMNALFSAQPDLSALGSPEPEISLVRQNTYVRVDESGTEAAAITEVGGISLALGSPEASMVVDRPFIFSIIEKSTGAVLFVGVVSNPAAGE